MQQSSGDLFTLMLSRAVSGLSSLRADGVQFESLSGVYSTNIY